MTRIDNILPQAVKEQHRLAVYHGDFELIDEAPRLVVFNRWRCFPKLILCRTTKVLVKLCDMLVQKLCD